MLSHPIGELRLTAPIQRCQKQDTARQAIGLSLLALVYCGKCYLMSRVAYNAVKRREAKSRMSAMRSARRSSSTALSLQERVSLVGHGKKWRITNFARVARAMAKWA